MLNEVFYIFGTKSWKCGVYVALSVYLHSGPNSSPEITHLHLDLINFPLEGDSKWATVFQTPLRVFQSLRRVYSNI